MKALSVKNPWAWLIIHRGKDVENRTWKTDHRGPLLIHASKRYDFHEGFDTLWRIEKTGLIDMIDFNLMVSGYPLKAGCMLGLVELVDCVQDAQSPWAEPGMWHWILKNPIPCVEPIPAKGRLGLWEFAGECNLFLTPAGRSRKY
jgi:hypothetical protein